MKLCADILYWRLKEELKTVELHGAGSPELTLSRPEFYLDRTQTFEKNRVYVCSADHLPARPSLRENVCLVCLGQHWNLTAFYDRCSVIVVEAETDIFRVFNLVQHIFDRYEAWEERLWHILRHGASLPQMLEVSRDILSNPMQLIGSDFRYLAVTDEAYFQKDLGIRLDTETFDAEKMATFLSLHDLSTHVHEPLLLELQDTRTLSVNVFDQEEYLGCLTVFEAFRVSNIIFYAYKGDVEDAVDISLVREGGELIVTLIDHGIAFDPTLRKDPDITLSAEDRPIGGLGIFLIKKIMDEVSYQRVDERNVFIMKKKITE